MIMHNTATHISYSSGEIVSKISGEIIPRYSIKKEVIKAKSVMGKLYLTNG